MWTSVHLIINSFGVTSTTDKGSCYVNTLCCRRLMMSEWFAWYYNQFETFSACFFGNCFTLLWQLSAWIIIIKKNIVVSFWVVAKYIEGIFIRIKFFIVLNTGLYRFLYHQTRTHFCNIIIIHNKYSYYLFAFLLLVYIFWGLKGKGAFVSQPFLTNISGFIHHNKKNT